MTAPGNWQITSVTGAASDSCTATSANVWHCSTLLQHGDPAHVFTVVASAETANSGDAITIDYTDPWSDEHVAMSLG